MNDDAIIEVSFDVDYSSLEKELKVVKDEFEHVSAGDTKAALAAHEHWDEVRKSITNVLREIQKTEGGSQRAAQLAQQLNHGVIEVKNSIAEMAAYWDSNIKSIENNNLKIHDGLTAQEKITQEKERQTKAQIEATRQLFESQTEEERLATARFDLARQHKQTIEETAEVQRQATEEAISGEQAVEKVVQTTTQEKIQGEQEVQQVRETNEKKIHSTGIYNFRKRRSLWIAGIKEAYNNVVKYTKMWMSLLGSAFAKVGSGFKNLLGNIFNRTGNQASSLFSNLKGLLGIAGGIGLYKLGSEAIKTSNDFKTMGNTSAVVARQMSNAFYEAAGDSYNSLVKLSNGTTQVTTTLKKFINTWTGQIALMKAQLTSIGSNIGNLLVKVFYPLLVVLNRILAVVNLLVGKLASLFGFNTANLKGILGDLGGQGKNNKGMEDYAKATDKAAKSTKKLKDETKKAKENLQGYDKLNNTTTNDLDDLSDTLDDLSDLGGIGAEGLIDTDALFDNLMQDLDLIPEWLKNWIDELVDLIKSGDWTGVGSKIGQLVNKGLYALNDFLSDTNLLKKIHNFNSALLDFVNGLVGTVNWKVLGTDIAKGLNTITFAIDDLYTQAVQKGTLNKIGKALADTFKGFLNNFDAEQAGRAAVSAARAMIDIVYSALSNINDDDINKIAEGIHGLVKGAFNRLLGLIDDEDITGAQKIGESIAKIINIGLETVDSLVNRDTATSAADAIIEILNSAIDGLDEDRMKKALSGMLQFIGTFFSKLATEINTDDFIEKVTNAINNSIQNGDVEEAVKGFTQFLNSVIQGLKQVIDKLDWKGLFNAIKDGFEEGGGSQILKDWAFYVLAPSVVLAFIHGVAKAAEWALLGSILKNGLFATLSKLAPALRLGGILGGAAGVGLGLFDSITNGLDKANAAATILSATLLGFSIGGPVGGAIGALAAGVAELSIGFIQDTDGMRTAAVKFFDDFDERANILAMYIFEGLTKISDTLRQNLADNIERTSYFLSGILFKVSEWLANLFLLLGNGAIQLYEKITEVRETIANKIKEIFDNIIQIGKDFIDETITLGENIVNGIAEGISRGADAVWTQIKNIAEGIPSIFSWKLDMHSPSRVMRDLAVYVPEGVALGIEDGTPEITSAMDSMLDSIKFSDFYSEALQETDVFVSDVTDKLAGIEAPTLDPLQYQSKILSSPAAATRALSQSYADTAGQRTDGVLSSIYNRMINAGQASGRNVIVDVYLDKNNRLGQYVIDTMKGQVVMTGGV